MRLVVDLSVSATLFRMLGIVGTAPGAVSFQMLGIVGTARGSMRGIGVVRATLFRMCLPVVTPLL
jgi:hypothetical protein